MRLPRHDAVEHLLDPGELRRTHILDPIGDATDDALDLLPFLARDALLHQSGDALIAGDELRREPRARGCPDALFGKMLLNVIELVPETPLEDCVELGILDARPASSIGDGAEQRSVARLLGSHEGHDRYAQAPLEGRDVDGLALGGSDIHEVHHEDGRAAKADEVREHVAAALELRCIDDDQHKVGAVRNDVIARHGLLGRLGIEAIGARKVDELVGAAVTREAAHLLLDRLTGPVAHMLARAGEPVEYGGLAGIGLPEQRDARDAI